MGKACVRAACPRGAELRGDSPAGRKPSPSPPEGYCIANHLHNGWSENSSFNGDHNGIGWIRSEQTGKAISGSAGNRVPTQDCITEQGKWGSVSNSDK